LCDALRPITQRDDPITLSLECEETILLDPNRAIPLGIIATELITNAVKYAFPEGQRGAIVMAARMVSETQIAFSVKDNGVGMSAPREGSLGFSLVETLVRQLRGQMRAEQSSGVAVTIVF
jgi:two-component sensor histidine kinase